MTLRETLTYTPVELKFGTSGRRGLVETLTQLEVYLNIRAELAFLLALPHPEGGIQPGDAVSVAYDLRPSSTALDANYGGRGELTQAAIAAIADAGLTPVNLGALPTPALAYYALTKHAASIMITGSHIPFDRNGYKLNTAVGELLKSHEPLIANYTDACRAEFYSQDASASAFNEHGMFRDGSRDLPPVDTSAGELYIARLATLFPDALAGVRLLFYQHSSVGRDLMPELFERLGAEVVRAGRSSVFVPIDTENLGLDQIATIQSLFDEAMQAAKPFDAIVSCDGDADRPLLLATHNGKVEFISGDLLGMLAAEFLQPDAVIVPISCNPAIDESPLGPILRPKTKIGSPYVIAGMEDAQAAGATRVCGWEANGGFLLGSDIVVNGQTLRSLPTRDAALPIVCALLLARSKGLSLHDTVALLPRCFGATALLRNFPRQKGLALVSSFSPAADSSTDSTLQHLRDSFTPIPLTAIQTTDFTDGIRMYGENGEIVHLRPSGNADEFRVYAIARSPERAAELAGGAEQFLRSHYA